eukprot:IDg20879t1
MSRSMLGSYASKRRRIMSLISSFTVYMPFHEARILVLSLRWAMGLIQKTPGEATRLNGANVAHRMLRGQIPESAVRTEDLSRNFFVEFG